MRLGLCLCGDVPSLVLLLLLVAMVVSGIVSVHGSMSDRLSPAAADKRSSSDSGDCCSCCCSDSLFLLFFFIDFCGFPVRLGKQKKKKKRMKEVQYIPIAMSSSSIITPSSFIISILRRGREREGVLNVRFSMIQSAMKTFCWSSFLSLAGDGTALG